MEHSVILSFRARPDMTEALDAEAARHKIARQVLLREIVETWMKQQDMFKFVFTKREE